MRVRQAHLLSVRARPCAVTQRRAPGSPGGAPAREERPVVLSRPAPGAPRAAVVMAPFTPRTDPDVAAALLMHHARYHLRMGFEKVIQYTQVRGPLR